MYNNCKILRNTNRTAFILTDNQKNMCIIIKKGLLSVTLDAKILNSVKQIMVYISLF